MKVLIATHQSQGTRQSDFSWTTDGELVGFPMLECYGESVDGGCGCKRSLCGFQSSKATTTATIEDRPDLDEIALRIIIGAKMEREGWTKICKTEDEKQGAIAEATRKTIRLYNTVALWPVGTIIERRGRQLRQRILKGERNER